MRIVADENIVLVEDAFSSLGDVNTMHGRSIDAEAVRDADVLLVRSVTKVNAALLGESSVRFVGSPTIGEDHIDKTYLESCGIGFANAPGSNANSVAEYVVSALMNLAEAREIDLSAKRLGIVGHGNVGKRVEMKARALGMDCVVNDPPLARQCGSTQYEDLDAVRECDIITFHVPLTKEGPDATAHLVDAAFLEGCKTGSIIFNTSRGDVIDGSALRKALASGKIEAAVLDVWENEPVVDRELLANCAIGTSHIAGYSYDGKVAGTQMIYEAVCQHIGTNPTWDVTPHLKSDQTDPIDLSSFGGSVEALRAAVRSVYDVLDDDKPMRELLTMPETDRGPHFDSLRKNYPRRREFYTATVRVGEGQSDVAHILDGLGFKMEKAGERC
jgi:erythronate-4-phosphate dehydrogenase